MDNKDYLIDLFIHDLTGVLSIVSTSVNGLLKRPDKYGPITEKQQKTLNMIVRNSNKAQNFLNEIIEIYKSDEGLFKKDLFPIQNIIRDSIIEAMEIVDLSNAEKFSFESSYEEFCRQLKEQGIFINISGKYESSPFCHDRKKIQQILRNLFTNALKHRREKVTIAISGDSDLMVIVEDDGYGIPKEKRESIFTRFFHQKETNRTESSTDGLGFGLSCVKSILTMMNGTINLSSCEGVGTSFKVRIPPLEE
ncbi:MAG: HAMP domain-containing histidine kinase [Spirochaetes bacterium]|nr:HAMP domain-containing histidine kinase [Spirochaetota bacterium]